MKVAVVGTGAWGTTLAVLLAGKGIETWLVARSEAEAVALRVAGCNEAFLPGIPLPASLNLTSWPAEALSGANVLLIAVPSQTVRANVRWLGGSLEESTLVISATKGLEAGTCLRVSEVLAEELPAANRGSVLVLSGPNLAREVARGLPATTVVAGEDSEQVTLAQELLACSTMRVYSNSDVIGVELAGALKNVIALAAGICDGMHGGDNAKAALITRGLAEITRLGVAAGAQPLTFAGLAGLGDLVATCASPLSRNRRLGELLASGKRLDEIQAGRREVAEGVMTTWAACGLAERYSVEMPIAQLMRQVLFEGKGLREASDELMARRPRGEFYGAGLI